MKIIEKKCPNCKAPLELNSDSKDITCEYCHSKFRIAKDPTEQGIELISKYSKKFMYFEIVLAVVIIAIFGTIIITLINNSKKNFDDLRTSTTEKVDEEFNKLYDDSMKRFDDLYDNYIKDFENEIDGLKDNLPKDAKITNYKIVGSYYLTAKKGVDTRIYTIYKRTLTMDDEQWDLYIAKLYSNLSFESLNDSIETKIYSSKYYLDESKSYYVEGYESIKELYNKNIKTLSNKYNIITNDKLYIEK